MRTGRLGWGLRFMILAALFITGASLVVMSLWNWLGPSLFAWPPISLAQAAGLLLLCRILFGGFLGHGAMHWRGRFAQRWEQMSPEERERFRAGMRGRCGRQAQEVTEGSGPAAST